MNSAVQEMLATDGYFTSSKKNPPKQFPQHLSQQYPQLPLQLSSKKPLSEYSRKDDKTPSMASVSKDIIYSPPDTLLKGEDMYNARYMS